MQSPAIPSPKSGRELVDEYFIENRTRVLEVAAFLDRLDRVGDAQAARDFRIRAFREALDVLTAGAARDAASRVQQIQMIFSDPTTEPLEHLDQKSARGAYDRWQGGGGRRRRPRHRPRGAGAGGWWRRGRREGMMRYIDLHAHMVSRTTDDYVRMALTGCVAVTEPAFWPGWDRSSADGFEDYFRQLTDFEPKRAAQYGIRHFTWLCLNPKEGEDRALAREVVRRIPKYLGLPNVLGIGEIGLNRVTRNELATFRDHVELALEHDQLIHIHTPHLEDKYKGTKTIVEALLSYGGRIDPARVMVDHAEEHTLDLILGNGFWTGLTLYPQTKVSPERAIDMLEVRGTERICVASACDWGPSLPDAVPHFALAMRRRGHDPALIDRVIFGNPAAFLGQSPKFALGAAATPAPARNEADAAVQPEDAVVAV